MSTVFIQARRVHPSPGPYIFRGTGLGIKRRFKVPQWKRGTRVQKSTYGIWAKAEMLKRGGIREGENVKRGQSECQNAKTFHAKRKCKCPLVVVPTSPNQRIYNKRPKCRFYVYVCL